MQRRKIGILQAEEISPEIQERSGALTERFRAMLDPAFDVRFWRVDEDQFPSSIESCDAWLISGSPAGVYDDFPWMGRLRHFLLKLKGKAPIVGVCFGHQLIADTFGGKAEKSAKGRAQGIHDYHVIAHDKRWMAPADLQRVAVAHGDQVTKLPPDAHVIAECEWTPHAIVGYPDLRILTMQCHPELTNDFARALANARRGKDLTDEQADDRLRTYETPLVQEALHQWINAVLADEAWLA